VADEAEDEFAEPELELDGPWKEALEGYFPDFFGFFFPVLFAAIDWSNGYEFLDKELEKLVPEASAGTGTVDKLAAVRLKDGTEQRVYIHIEVQNQPQGEFPARMYAYNHRLQDRYGRMPISIALLGDDRASWRPAFHEEECFGCRVRFEFLSAKLLDYNSQSWSLMDDPNPFAAFALAHLQTLATRGKPNERLESKWTLLKGLFERGLDRSTIVRLLRVVDWVMKLRPPERREYDGRLKSYREERMVPFVSTLERFAKEDGKKEGIEMGLERGQTRGRVMALCDAIESILDVRFGPEGMALMPRVRLIEDPDRLLALPPRIVTATTAVEVADLLPNETTSHAG